MLQVKERFLYNPNLVLYLPFSEMEVGRSPNLLSNAGFESGTTGWEAVGNAVLESETTIIKAGAKSLKVTSGDQAYTGARQYVLNPTKYLGITASASTQGRADSGNTQNGTDINLQTYNGSTYVSTVSIFARDDAWYQKTVSVKIPTNTVSIAVKLNPNDTAVVDADEIAYFDEVEFTVPQSMSKDHYGRIIHPEGCSWRPQGFLFDGVDDIVTSEFDSVVAKACTIMVWLRPTAVDATTRRVLSNGKLDLSMVNNNLAFSSDYYTTTASSGACLYAGKWVFAAVTRTAANPSVVNFYINGVKSGVANQSSGNPAAGSWNISVGNRPAGDRSCKSVIDDLRVYTDEVMEQPEIQNVYLQTKGQYGL